MKFFGLGGGVVFGKVTDGTLLQDKFTRFALYDARRLSVKRQEESGDGEERGEEQNYRQQLRVEVVEMQVTKQEKSGNDNKCAHSSKRVRVTVRTFLSGCQHGADRARMERCLRIKFSTPQGGATTIQGE